MLIKKIIYYLQFKANHCSFCMFMLLHFDKATNSGGASPLKKQTLSYRFPMKNLKT